MAYRIREKRGTAAQWATANPVLGLGERGIVTDSRPYRFKTGDGVTAWNSLPYDTLPDATTVASGLMSATDKSRLDSINTAMGYLPTAAVMGMPAVTAWYDVVADGVVTLAADVSEVGMMAIDNVFVEKATTAILTAGRHKVAFYADDGRVTPSLTVPQGLFRGINTVLSEIMVSPLVYNIYKYTFAHLDTTVPIVLPMAHMPNLETGAIDSSQSLFVDDKLVSAYTTAGFSAVRAIQGMF